MPFPITKRIIYKNNPLVEVICQFRFHPILSIETEIPAKLQNVIRSKYPLFTENAEILFTVPNISNDVDAAVAEKLKFPSTTLNRKNYEFRSSDENWKINLTREFFALSTIKYHRWEEFRTQLDEAFHAFIDIYSPAYFSRIGLRYKDIINRSSLGLKDANWSNLLQPYILGILNVPTISPNVISATNITEIRLSDNQSVVRITSGIIQEEKTSEEAFIIDCDFFTNQKTGIEESLDMLNYFNQRGSRLIQWCITEKLHNAMEPENI